MLHELLVQLPHEDFLYLGDTARFPYGDRSRDELECFSLQIAEELLTRRAKLLFQYLTKRLLITKLVHTIPYKKLPQCDCTTMPN